MSVELITAGLNLAGGLLGGGGGSDDAYKTTMDAAAGAIRAQEKWGINALELIRSGSGGGGGSKGPRIGSMAAMSQGFDQISDVLTGRTAQRAAREKVQDELARIELEQRRAEVAKLGTKVPRAISPALKTAPIGTGTPTSNVPEPEVMRPTITSANVSHNGAWVDPHTPDAETVEARYGDLLQEVGGVRNIVNDTVFNGRMNKISAAHGPEFAQKVYDEYNKSREESLTEVYKRLLPEGEQDALKSGLSNPQEYEKPVMSEKPKVGWMDKQYGASHAN